MGYKFRLVDRDGHELDRAEYGEPGWRLGDTCMTHPDRRYVIVAIDPALEGDDVTTWTVDRLPDVGHSGH